MKKRNVLTRTIVTLTLILVMVAFMPVKAFAMQIFVKTTSGRHITLEVEPTDRISDIKFKVQDKVGILAENQMLVFGGNVLQDNETLQNYSIQKDSTLHLALPCVSAFATRDELMNTLQPDGSGRGVGKIVFGKDSEGNPFEWYILGKDTGVRGDNIAIFAASPIVKEAMAFERDSNKKTDEMLWADCDYSGSNVSVVYPSHYGSSDLRDELAAIAKDSQFFTVAEQGLMQPTRIQTKDSYNNYIEYVTEDVLYALSADGYQDTFIKAGATDDKILSADVYWSSGEMFWLRSPDNTYEQYVSAAFPDNAYVVHNYPNMIYPYVRPASNINMTNVLFASAASSGEDAGIIPAGTAMNFRLDGSGMPIGSAFHNAEGGTIMVDKAEETSDVTLIVQGNDGTNDWFYSRNITADTTVNVTEIKTALAAGGIVNIDLAACKIWLETTADDGMAYAVMAEPVLTISDVAVTVDTPVGNEPFDTTVECTTTGVKSVSVIWKDTDGNPVTGNAKFDPWTYVAHFTFEPEEGYVFSVNTTASINNGNVLVDTGAILNNDGTLSVISDYIISTKAKITGAVCELGTGVVFRELYNKDNVLLSAELPTHAVVSFEDGNMENMEVEWTLSDEYDATPDAVNTFTWTVKPDEYVAHTLTNTAVMSGSVNITNKAYYSSIAYIADGYLGIYDGQPHGIRISLSHPTEVMITYSTDGVNYSTTEPQYTNPGVYIIHYRLESAGYLSANGRASITILQKDLTVEADDQTISYGNAIEEDLYTVSELVAGDRIETITLIPSTAEVTDDGTISVGNLKIVNSAGEDVTGNYNISYTEGQLVIGENVIESSVTDYKGTYDGQSQGITVNVNSLADAIVTYSTDGVNYSATAPQFTNVGTYTVYYRIEKENYTTVNGSKTIVISPKELTVTASDQTIAYGENIDTTGYTADGLIKGDCISSVKLTPTTVEITDDGAINVSDIKVINSEGEDVTANYNVICIAGKLIVESNDIETGDEEEKPEPEEGNSDEGESQPEPEDGNGDEGESQQKPEDGNNDEGESQQEPEDENTGEVGGNAGNIGADAGSGTVSNASSDNTTTVITVPTKPLSPDTGESIVMHVLFIVLAGFAVVMLKHKNYQE